MSFDDPEFTAYVVEEPTTPRLFGEGVPRGERGPSRDEALLELIDDWAHLDNEQIAETFGERGDDMLESFIERHEADLPDGQERRLRQYLKQLVRHSDYFQEEGVHTGAPKALAHMLKTQVVPVVAGPGAEHAAQASARPARRHPGQSLRSARRTRRPKQGTCSKRHHD